MTTAISVAIIDNKRILLVKKKDTLILPGGKPEEGESDSACLYREVGEELSGTRINPKTLEYFADFEGISPNKRLFTRVKVYLAELDSDVRGPSNEILDRDWFAYSEKCEYSLSNITNEIIEALHNRSYF